MLVPRPDTPDEAVRHAMAREHAATRVGATSSEWRRVAAAWHMARQAIERSIAHAECTEQRLRAAMR